MSAWCVVANVVAFGSLGFCLLVTRNLATSLRSMRLHTDTLVSQVFKLIEECDRLQAALAKERAAVLAAKGQKPPEH